ncbi:unnamed protein product [Phytophthora fragariaefolia]|uniref:Unnamed protein product n=1 Tax=Phytophthora fragariaefolia TaxID=1490495 RepID=A0A9W6UCY3_9STRA|nr:unnamed protein product [Phytophthora fragariaefolia]
MKNKWLAYHAGRASEPTCLALMDSFWGNDTEEVPTSKSPRQSRPSPEQQKQSKRPRLVSTSSAPGSDAKAEVKTLTLIAPAPAEIAAPISAASAPSVTSASSSPSPTMAGHIDTAASVTTPDASMSAVSQGFIDIASATGEVARPNDTSLTDGSDLSKLGKLIDDRFAEVLEAQEKQLRLSETQNQLLAQLLAALQRNSHD